MADLPILYVETAHSAYVIDQNAGKYSRTRVHEDANSLAAWGVGDDGEWVDYADIASPLEIGESLHFYHGDGTWVRSTPIKSIREVVQD